MIYIYYKLHAYHVIFFIPKSANFCNNCCLKSESSGMDSLSLAGEDIVQLSHIPILSLKQRGSAKKLAASQSVAGEFTRTFNCFP